MIVYLFFFVPDLFIQTLVRISFSFFIVQHFVAFFVLLIAFIFLIFLLVFFFLIKISNHKISTCFLSNDLK